jgi:hypothetical protein
MLHYITLQILQNTSCKETPFIVKISLPENRGKILNINRQECFIVLIIYILKILFRSIFKNFLAGKLVVMLTSSKIVVSSSRNFKIFELLLPSNSLENNDAPR